jgi:tRNA (guanine26-N2/guanine27-N2)-dimethyltransferase
VSVEFPTREIREGRAELVVPDVPTLRGPGRRSSLPFYNPHMRVNRDLTVLLWSAVLPKGARVLDGMAATGVLGIRGAMEAGRELAVTWNDKNPSAHELIVQNAARNSVAGEVLEGDLRVVLAKRRWDCVDIDPFGTPVPFVDGAFQQAWKGAVVGITATDTAPLAGTYPGVCLRRYGARSLPTPCQAETALRIFVGYLARIAASHERGIHPLVAFAAQHFVKAIVAVDARTSSADASLAHLGYVRFEGARFTVSASPPNGAHAGPLWLGPLSDSAVLGTMAEGMDTTFEAAQLLRNLRDEAGLPPFFYEDHALAQTLHLDPVPVDSWLAALRSAGFRATRPHVTANGVKTDAPWDDVERIYRQLQER